MAILESEVWVKINQRNITYYKKLGYSDLEIHKDYLIKVEHLSENSRAKVTKKCDSSNCDVEGGRCILNQSYQTVMQSRKKNKVGYDLCKNCSKVLIWENRKNNIKYEKTLEYYAKVNNKEHLINEYSDKNKKKPNEVSFSTLDKYLWNCPKCLSEYSVSTSTRTNCDSACPYCHGKSVNHTNCLWTTHPEIAKLLSNREDGYKLTKGTHKKTNWKCVDCGYILKNKSVNSIATRGMSCPRCSDGYSYPEKLMFNLLHQLDIDFSFQKQFQWSNNKKYDFYIPAFSCIIETHGRQHYHYTGFKRSLDEEKDNDRLKEKLAIYNGIRRYVIIDCSESSLEFIKNNIFTSDLNTFLNLKKIDWLNCNAFACSSLMKTVCSLFNEKYMINEIMKKLKISKTPVLDYLKKGAKLGWCDYDPKEQMKKSGSMSGKRKSKPVVRLSLQGELVDEFKSGSEAGRILGISNKDISLVCRKKKKSVGGYLFMFKSDFENKLYINGGI